MGLEDPADIGRRRLIRAGATIVAGVPVIATLRPMPALAASPPPSEVAGEQVDRPSDPGDPPVDVLGGRFEAPGDPDTEVLGRQFELASTGADLATLLALSGTSIAAGASAVWLAGRHATADGAEDTAAAPEDDAPDDRD